MIMILVVLLQQGLQVIRFCKKCYFVAHVFMWLGSLKQQETHTSARNRTAFSSDVQQAIIEPSKIGQGCQVANFLSGETILHANVYPALYYFCYKILNALLIWCSPCGRSFQWIISALNKYLLCSPRNKSHVARLLMCYSFIVIIVESVCMKYEPSLLFGFSK